MGEETEKFSFKWQMTNISFDAGIPFKTTREGCGDCMHGRKNIDKLDRLLDRKKDGKMVERTRDGPTGTRAGCQR